MAKEDQKKCVCAKPEINQVLPDGFSGVIKCAACSGLVKWPQSVKKYEGKDPVEGLLFEMEKRHSCLTVETAVITMLLRIERAIVMLATSEKAKK
jgi:hypothetical protein